jgi:hypothetical protein
MPAQERSLEHVATDNEPVQERHPEKAFFGGALWLLLLRLLRMCVVFRD